MDSHTYVAVLQRSPEDAAHPVSSEQGLPATPVVHMFRLVGAEPEQYTEATSSRPKMSVEERINNLPGPVTGDVVGLVPATFPGIQSEATLQPQVFVLRHTPEAHWPL